MTLHIQLKDGHTVEIIKRRSADFTALTGIDVVLRVVDEIAAHDTFIESAKSGRGPDITTVSFWYLPEYVRNGMLVPVSELELSLHLGHYHPHAVDALSVDDILYAVPHTLIGAMLMANRRLLEAVGLPSPRTADEILATAETVSINTPAAGLVARGAPDFPSFGTYAGWAAGYGVRLLDDACDPSRLVRVLGPLIEAIRRFGPPDPDTMDYVAAGDTMMRGEAGMLLDTSAWGNFFEDPHVSQIVGEVDYVIPRGPESPLQFLYAEGLAVPVWSPNRKAATEFIEWRHSDPVLLAEAAEIRIDFPRIDLAESSRFMELVETKCLGPYRRALLQAWDTIDGSYFPLTPTFVEDSRLLMTSISACLGGSSPTYDTLIRALSQARPGDR